MNRTIVVVIQVDFPKMNSWIPSVDSFGGAVLEFSEELELAIDKSDMPKVSELTSVSGSIGDSLLGLLCIATLLKAPSLSAVDASFFLRTFFGMLKEKKEGDIIIIFDGQMVWL